MRVLVCGGRDFTDRTAVWGLLQAVHLKRGIGVLIHGACPTGADRLADEWAAEESVPIEAYPAVWKLDGRLDRSAGPRRNQRMMDEGKPDLVIAFPGGKGTDDMVRRAKAAGVKVFRPI
jgi:hypothetical protein